MIINQAGGVTGTHSFGLDYADDTPAIPSNVATPATVPAAAHAAAAATPVDVTRPAAAYEIASNGASADDAMAEDPDDLVAAYLSRHEPTSAWHASAPHLAPAQLASDAMSAPYPIADDVEMAAAFDDTDSAPLRSGHRLPKELWGEIAKFASREDLLHLRTADKRMANWVDKSINHIDVPGEDVLDFLATIRQSPNLKHIETLRIVVGFNETRAFIAQFQAMVAALAQVPHSKMHIEIAVLSAIISDADLASLSTIRPASLHLSNLIRFSPSTAALLSRIPYALKITELSGEIKESELLMLASIPNLTSLTVFPHNLSDTVAHAFAVHPALTELHMQVDEFSDAAIAILAGNAKLKSLEFANYGHVFGSDALEALAANHTLERLVLYGFDDDGLAAIEGPGALILSKNTSLKELHISLRDGYRHLATMKSLETLIIREGNSPIGVADAKAFAEHAQLKSLHIVRDQDADDLEHEGHEGALAHLLSSRVEQVVLVGNMRAEDIVAVMANASLRSFSRQHRGFAEEDLGFTYALLAHPTLRALRIYSDPHHPAPPSSVLAQHRAAFTALWVAGKRPESALLIDM